MELTLSGSGELLAIGLTMEVACLHTKDEIERFCRKNPYLHLYALGDLDDFFWPHTTWYALRQGADIQQLVLVYADQALPTVLALADEPIDGMRELLRELIPLLPRRFYAHASHDIIDAWTDAYGVSPRGHHFKMGLLDRERLAQVDGTRAVMLSAADLDDLLTFYAASYPGNWFVPRMLETGFYFGVRRGRTLAGVAGVHVYSPKYKVAALGNIATRPDARGQGLATVVTARLCHELLRAGIEHIGLNVKADNGAAIACYEKLGFERVAEYGEFHVASR
jgi:ribosomal protein S18 acetylase RimI-like enzyme